MQELQFVLVIGLLIYSIYSLVTYKLRRRRNKASLSAVDRSAEPLRRITEEERAWIQPYLTSPANPTQPVALRGDEVYRIAGPYVRHGLESDSATVAMHDTIGGVDVILPYDANLFLAEDNVAEVVLTAEFAVVLRLNDGFDLAGARERQREERAMLHQWREGGRGELAGASVLRDGTVDICADDEAHNRVRILGQRDETPAEAAARNHPGFGLLPLLPLLPAFILMMVAGYSDQGEALYWFLPALLLLAFALAMIWRRPGAPERQKVNRVEGTLNVLTLNSHENSVVVSDQLFLGDKLLISLPAHWQPRIRLPPDSRVDVDMRVEDQSIVRFGRKFSLDEEQRRFPPIYWGRHLVLTLAGGAMLLFAWAANPDLAGDIEHAGATLGSEVRKIGRPLEVRADPPAVGSMVRVSAEVQCQIARPRDDLPGPIDCEQVRLGGDPLQFVPVEADPTLLGLHDGELLHTRPDPRFDKIMEAYRQRTGGSYDNPYYGIRPKFVMIDKLTELVLAVNEACLPGRGENALACSHLQELMGASLLLEGGGDGGIGWPALLAAARNGSLARKGNAALALSELPNELRHQLRAITAPLLRDAYRPAMQTLLASQRGGVLLPLGFAGRRHLELPETTAKPAVTTTWPQQWAVYEAHASAPRLHRLDITGMVVRSERDGHGDPVLEIDPGRHPGNGTPAIVRLFVIVLGAAFTVTHATLWYRERRRAQARERALAAYLASRH